MAIYGSGYPQFKSLEFNPNAVISLQYSFIEENWSIPQFVKNTSVYNRTTAWTEISEDFAEFVVTVYVWKYVDPADTMNTLMGYNHDKVNFMPHNDAGIYVAKTVSTLAEFRITKMEPMYLRIQPPDYKDILRITFSSITSVNKQHSAPS